jgi:hypothetical protein
MSPLDAIAGSSILCVQHWNFTRHGRRVLIIFESIHKILASRTPGLTLTGSLLGNTVALGHYWYDC